MTLLQLYGKCVHYDDNPAGVYLSGVIGEVTLGMFYFAPLCIGRIESKASSVPCDDFIIFIHMVRDRVQNQANGNFEEVMNIGLPLDLAKNRPSLENTVRLCDAILSILPQ